MIGGGITWTNGDPNDIAAAAEKWLGTITTAAGRAAVSVGQSAENTMRNGAPWQNETGNARRGLRVETMEKPDAIEMYFIHSVEYGIYLELSRGGKYAIVYPTMLDTVPLLRNALRGLANA